MAKLPASDAYQFQVHAQRRRRVARATRLTNSASETIIIIVRVIETVLQLGVSLRLPAHVGDLIAQLSQAVGGPLDLCCIGIFHNDP